MSNEKYAYFKDGVLKAVKPRENKESLYEDRDVAYQADNLIIDDKYYDINSVYDVAAIPIPNFQHDGWDSVFDLSYILKIHCGVIEDKEVIRVLVPKVLALMDASPVGWGARDYLQVIRNFYRLGMFEYGDKFEKQYRDKHPAYFNNLYEKYEKEHISTKAYFKRKWEKKTLKQQKHDN